MSTISDSSESKSHDLGTLRKKTRLAVATLVFLLSATLATALIWELEQSRRSSVRAEALIQVGVPAQTLQQNIQRALSATYTLFATIAALSRISTVLPARCCPITPACHC
jgi:alpha-mannosidase